MACDKCNVKGAGIVLEVVDLFTLECKHCGEPLANKLMRPTPTLEKAAEILEKKIMSPVLAKDKDGNDIYATEHEQIMFSIIAKALRGEE